MAAAILSALPWAILFRADRRWTMVRLGLIAILTTMPPLGWFQWMSPFLGLAYLSPLQGWVAVVVGMGVLALLIHHPSRLWMAFPLIALAAVWAPADREGLHGWGAIAIARTTTGLNIGEKAGSSAGARGPGRWHNAEGFVQTFEGLRGAAREAASRELRVAVLGESAGGEDLEGARLALGHSSRTIFVVGGRQRVGQGAQAQLWVFGTGAEPGTVAYRQRTPAPIVSGQLPTLGGPVTITIDGRTIAPLICYEGLTAWALASALWARPEALVLVSNTAWSSLDRFAHAQLASHLQAWGRLFGVPTLIASNRAP